MEQTFCRWRKKYGVLKEDEACCATQHRKVWSNAPWATTDRQWAKASTEMVAAAIRTVFAQPDATHVRSQLAEVTRMLNGQFPVVAAMLADAAEDLLAFTAFPQPHWRKIWSTNPLERVNGEIKRRTNVVGIFPNDASVARLVTAVIVETHDEWAVAERRYLSEESMAKLLATDIEHQDPKTPLAAITA